jgi:ribonuclease R
VRGRFGFVLSEEPGTPDVYVGPETLRLAMDGDRVLVRVLPEGSGGGRAPAARGGGARRSGEILKVLQRARDTVVGVFQRLRGADVLMPEIGGEPVKVLDRGGLSPKEGELAVVKVTAWPDASRGAAGVLNEILGLRDEPGVDVKAIVRKYELPEAFPADVLQEARGFGDEVPEAALAGRTTYFHVPVFTIDGADAKDFDDAVSLEPAPSGGWRLGVHIADVAHYVREGGPLDEEAFRRGTSVYLVDRVVPMLPHQLSDDLCSLRPDRLRLTLSCVMDIDAEGRVTDARLLETAIKSARRFTYEEVEDILRGGDAPSPPDVLRDVKAMGGLARLLREKRFRRGSLDFDFPEPQAFLDADGRPLDIRRRIRLESHRLIEEFMLLANETVAGLMKDFPFLYRVHEKPDKEKLGKMKDTLRAVGVAVPQGLEEGRSDALQKLLAAVEDLPVKPMVHTMVLRSMKQAVYSPQNAGHFGLASPLYTHFTSPIRRYPDLCVHRIVKQRLHNRLNLERQAQWKRSLPHVCARTSGRERLAQEAERESLDLKRVQLMRKRVGESFDGIVSGVTAFGFFVQLREVFVEGLVHVSNLRDDHYVYDELHARLMGRRTGP